MLGSAFYDLACYCSRVPSWPLTVGSSGGNYGGAGHLVVGVEVEEADAGGAAAGLGFDPDDIAELADDHYLGGVVDEVDAGDLADFAGGLHVEDTLAAAGLVSTILPSGTTFAESASKAPPKSSRGSFKSIRRGGPCKIT